MKSIMQVNIDKVRDERHNRIFVLCFKCTNYLYIIFLHTYKFEISKENPI